MSEPKMRTGGLGVSDDQKFLDPKNRDGGCGVGIPLKKQIEVEMVNLPKQGLFTFKSHKRLNFNKKIKIFLGPFRHINSVSGVFIR